MPQPVNELKNGDSFPVKPGTNEYKALSFLVQNREFGYRPSEIADLTDITKSSVSKTMIRLVEKGLVERSDGLYYVDPDQIEGLKRRLDSIDAATRIHETTPTDAYSEKGWEAKLSSVKPETEESTPDISDKNGKQTEAEKIVNQVADSKNDDS